jgi:hypothetical protein
MPETNSVATNMGELSKNLNNYFNETQKKKKRTSRKHMKLKSFCTRKEMVSKLKRPPTEWEIIFATYTSDIGLTPRIVRELKKLNSPQINDPIKK